MALQPDAVVAIAGGKGGTGKTTASLGLARALTDRGPAPIVADADVDLPDLHVRARVGREPGLPALLEGEQPAIVAQKSPRLPGVSVIAAGTARVPTHRALARLTGLGRPILVDCPPGAGPDAVDPLRNADGAVLVTTSTAPGRRDAAKTARIAKSLEVPPVAWLERRTDGGRHATDRHRPSAIPTVSVPDVPGRPLRSPAVRQSFETLATRVYGRT